MPDTEDFCRTLDLILAEAQANGKADIVVVSGGIHRQVGGYPDPDHCMRSCCRVRYETMKGGDEIVSAPPSGQGATLSIRYRLPR